MSKLSDQRNDLWQKPKKKINGTEKAWFHNGVIGRDKLNDTMKNLSKSAKLSKIYTNHCIRATVVSTLEENNVNGRVIIATTNHKSESSIKHYARKISSKKRREVCDLLAKEMGHQPPEKVPKVPEKSASSTLSVPTDNANINEPENPEEPENPDAIPDVLQEDEMQLISAEMQLEEQDPDRIDDTTLVKILENIEKENAHLFPAPQPTQNQVLNVSNVQNVNTNKAPLPIMYFNNSTVTINYNYSK